MFEKNEELLEDKVLKTISKLKSVDIIVGIPSFNNANTIGNVVSNFANGLEQYFPHFKSLIINSDGGSTDGTREIVEKIRKTRGIEIITTQYKGPSGKGSAFRTIFEVAKRLEAKVIVVSDSDNRSITPKWCYALVNPVLRLGYGYVTPYYTRDKHDATITNALVYPITRALYGLRLRQPIGGDFAFSNGALQIFLQKKYWNSYPYITKFGIDIWMTTIAINEGFRVCQTVLGVKEHDAKDPGKDLSPMFLQVTGTMFDLMNYYEFRWRNVLKSNQGFIFGDFKFFEAERIKIDLHEMLRKFYEGCEKYKDIWKAVFSKKTYNEFLVFFSRPKNNELVISVQLWAKIVYDYACAYNFSKQKEKKLILESMVPLYYIRAASFVKEAEYFDDEIADAVMEGNAGVFERMKGYLIKRWDYYEKK